MSEIDRNLLLGRLALSLLRRSLRDMDEPDPIVKLSAASWFASHDEGFCSFPSSCQYLADYVRSMDPSVVQEYEQDAKVQEIGTLQHSEHWRALVESGLDGGPDARGALCDMLRKLVDPEAKPSEPSVLSKTLNHDRGSAGFDAPGMS